MDVQVLIHYNSSAGPAEEVVNKIKGLRVQAVAAQADASSAEFGKTLVDAALKAFNTDTIDIIVSNAGHAAPNFEGTKSVGFDEWDPIFQINVRGPFVLIQAALPYMKEGGRIVKVGSIISRLGSLMLPVYSAAKGALTSMTEATPEELGPRGITANLVSPGPIATDLSMKGPPIATGLGNNQYIKREGTRKEVGKTILFMASPAASYITGQVIHVDEADGDLGVNPENFRFAGEIVGHSFVQQNLKETSLLRELFTFVPSMANATTWW